MSARQKLELGVGLEIAIRVIDVLSEGETWLNRTGGIGGLSGSDIVLSGPTEGEDWDEEYQQMATHSHGCKDKNRRNPAYDSLRTRLNVNRNLV